MGKRFDASYDMEAWAQRQREISTQTNSSPAFRRQMDEIKAKDAAHAARWDALYAAARGRGLGHSAAADEATGIQDEEDAA